MTARAGERAQDTEPGELVEGGKAVARLTEELSDAPAGARG